MVSESGVILYISAVEVFSLVIALVLVVLAFRSYRKSGIQSFLFAAVGFGMLGVASLIEGLLYQFAGFPLDEAQAFRSTLTALGLVILVYSIYRTQTPGVAGESAGRGNPESAAFLAVSLAADSRSLDTQRPV